MGLWHWLSLGKRRSAELLLLESERLQLLQEIKRAHIEWIAAQQRLDFVLEKEQIDYAIFALEASQIRLDMLIKQAKAMKLSALEVS